MNVVKKLLRVVAGPVLALMLPFAASAQQYVGCPGSCIRDAEIEQILRDYGDPLFAAAGLKPSDVDLHIVQDNSLNAFVALGQHMFINTGTIMEAETPEQLKGVMAHETGHIALGHNITRSQAMGAAQGTSLITLGLGALALAAGAPDAAMALFGSAGQFGMLTMFKFTRAEESAADQYGLDLLQKTGQSGQGLVDFFEKFAYEEMMSESRREPYFRSHPISRDRVGALRKRAETVRCVAAAEPGSAGSNVQHCVVTEQSTQDEKSLQQLAMMKAKLVGFIGPANKVLTRYPQSDQSLPAKYARAIAAYRAVDIKAALRGTQELIDAEPFNPYFYELKGQILFESGKAEESIEPHRRSVELAPNQPLLKVNLARSLTATKKPENVNEAEGLLIDARDLEKNNPFTWNQLAAVYAAQGRIGDADLATAEEAYILGAMSRAQHFAGRALKELDPSTPNGQRASDIAALSDPRNFSGRRTGRKPLAYTDMYTKQ
jgi:predicted Zn-dependent protease